ncbi:hypothetical protein [Isoptericola aurantiacus]|uniref:hypothetical protein n=1 Tax=Isoptericola aurantiacus TaxID=3377839 RepID=UPI00383AD5DF
MALLAMISALAPPAMLIALVVIAVALVRGASRGGDAEPTDRPGLLEQRLDHLDRLRASGRITDEERDAARAHLLGRLPS